MDAQVVTNVKNELVAAISANPMRNVKLGDVLFDNRYTSDIYYHDDLPSFSDSVEKHLPKPELQFKNATEDSDIFTVLYDFLANEDIPLCGSTVLILLKRWRQNDVPFYYMKQLHEKRVTVNIISSNHMILPGHVRGTFLLPMYTNGLDICAGEKSISNDSSFPLVARKVMSAPYLDNLLYSTSVYLIQNVTNQPLDTLKVPEYSDTDSLLDVTLVITTDAVQASEFQWMDLRVVNKATGKKSNFAYDQRDFFEDSDSIWKTIKLESGSVNDVFVDYETVFSGSLLIRMYINRPV